MFMFIFIILILLALCAMCGGISEMQEARKRKGRREDMIEYVKSEILDRGYGTVEVQSTTEIDRSIVDRIRGRRNFKIYVTTEKENYLVKANDKGDIHEIRKRKQKTK